MPLVSQVCKVVLTEYLRKIQRTPWDHSQSPPEPLDEAAAAEFDDYEEWSVSE